MKPHYANINRTTSSFYYYNRPWITDNYHSYILALYHTNILNISLNSKLHSLGE